MERKKPSVVGQVVGAPVVVTPASSSLSPADHNPWGLPDFLLPIRPLSEPKKEPAEANKELGERYRRAARRGITCGG